MKRFWLNIVIFFNTLFRGMKSADMEAFQGTTTQSKDGSGVEHTQESKNVFQNLLRGELTQEVIEMRYEMYQTERESKKFAYNGNGTAVRKENEAYQRLIENSDNDEIYVVQDNKETNGSLDEFGIYTHEDNISIAEKSRGDLRLKEKREYIFNIKRNFFPQYRIEEFTKKIVLKKREEKVIVDLYISMYNEQFNKRQNMFLVQIKKIINGDTRSDIINFDNLNFISFNAYGTDDLKFYEIGRLKFDKIILFDGNYILRFIGDFLVDGEDLTDEFYDEIAAEKCRTKAPRENAVAISLDAVLEKQARDNYDTDTAEKLLNDLKNEH